VDSPSLEILKNYLDEFSVQPALGERALAGTLDYMIPRGPFQPLSFYDSVIL